jgi:hypothetical protein
MPGPMNSTASGISHMPLAAPASLPWMAKSLSSQSSRMAHMRTNAAPLRLASSLVCTSHPSRFGVIMPHHLGLLICTLRHCRSHYALDNVHRILREKNQVHVHGVCRTSAQPTVNAASMGRRSLPSSTTLQSPAQSKQQQGNLINIHTEPCMAWGCFFNHPLDQSYSCDQAVQECNNINS